MIYEFRCNDCNLNKEVYRPWQNYSDPEICDKCGNLMHREYSPPRFTVFHDYYNHGLGIKVRRKDDISDHLKKVRDKTGQDVIEIGNEKQKCKKKRKSYELTRDEYQLAEKIYKGELE